LDDVIGVNMLKRIMFLLFGIDGIIEIETLRDIKIVVIRWRVNRKHVNEVSPKLAEDFLPAGWKAILIVERW